MRPPFRGVSEAGLRSGLIDQIQKMTAAAMQMAEKKVPGVRQVAPMVGPSSLCAPQSEGALLVSASRQRRNLR